MNEAGISSVQKELETKLHVSAIDSFNELVKLIPTKEHFIEENSKVVRY